MDERVQVGVELNADEILLISTALLQLDTPEADELLARFWDESMMPTMLFRLTKS